MSKQLREALVDARAREDYQAQKAAENISYAANAVIDVVHDLDRKVAVLKRIKGVDKKKAAELERGVDKLTRLAGDVNHDAQQLYFAMAEM